MKLSREADYALRAIRYFSGLPRGRLASINTVARAANLPREFLAKILKDLAVSGILVSYRGVTGGYRLSRPAGKISFLDVIEAVKGRLHLSLCTESRKCTCRQSDHCHMHEFWVAQEKAVRNALRRQTFGG